MNFCKKIHKKPCHFTQKNIWIIALYCDSRILQFSQFASVSSSSWESKKLRNVIFMLIKWLILYFLLVSRNGNLAKGERELIFEREQQRECEKKTTNEMMMMMTMWRRRNKLLTREKWRFLCKFQQLQPVSSQLLWHINKAKKKVALTCTNQDWTFFRGRCRFRIVR